jgi:hypothetical protein|tara:strand:+ start:4433 stop:4681 length:249 start_codon:yes stop_codon:yes gene_type:complete
MEEKPTLMTAEEVEKGVSFLNIVYQAAISNVPTGLVPEAAAAQRQGIQEAAQNVVDLIQAHGPLAEERAKMMEEAIAPVKNE